MIEETYSGQDDMLYISLESKGIHFNEFNESVDFDLIHAILLEEGLELKKSATINRLCGVFRHCRAIYKLDVEAALCVCYNALSECLKDGRCPTTACIEDYRKVNGPL